MKTKIDSITKLRTLFEKSLKSLYQHIAKPSDFLNFFNINEKKKN